MPKRKVEDELEQLSALRLAAPGEVVIAALRKALRDRVNVIVAKAASIAAELNLCALIPDMLTAFDRLFLDPAKNDPQCWGKNALSKALTVLGHSEAATFMRGLQHVQMEPVWKGQEDTAAVLRGACALALIQCTDIPVNEMHTQLIDVLADRAQTVRLDAARALAELGTPEAILLLRLKARLGDADPSVTGEILSFLLRLEEDHAVPFAGSFLDHVEGEVREEAALALGGSRLPASIVYLRERWASSPGLAQILIRAFGASRLDAAVLFLVEIVRTARTRDALAALEALKPHRESSKLWQKISAAAGGRRESEVAAYFTQHFPKPEN